MKRFWVLTAIVILSLVSIVFLLGCVSKSEHEALQSEYEALLTKYAILQTDFEANSKELNDFKQIYPPKDFSSISELEEWVSKHLQPNTSYLEETFRAALKVQEAGIEDGYLISVMYDEDDRNPDAGWIFNAALVTGYLCYWHPVYGDVRIVPGFVK